MNDARAERLLEELVRIPSPSREERDAVQFLTRELADLGFESEIDAAGNAVGRIGGQGPRLCLLGHIDTVPGEVPVERRDGALYGRGTVDAKGPLVAFVVAAARAAARGELAARVEIVGCVEEECSTSAGAHHRAAGPAPDAVIVGEPSGSDALTLGYKGYLRARLSRREPVAHTAAEAPSVAALAARTFVEIEQAARELDGDRAALYERVLVHLAHLDVRSDALHERAELDVRLRLPERLPPTAAASWLAEQAPGWDLVTEGGLPAWSGPRDSGLVRLLSRAIARGGNRARHLRKTGTADLNIVAPAWGCPALAYGPGDSSLDHAPDEHVPLAEFHRGCATLERLLVDGALSGLVSAP
ncbi:MAG: [LysW]-lysine hydrolase [Planctomycetota bacterium]